MVSSDLNPTKDPGIDQRPEHILTGCLLAVAGNLLISISLNLQKYVHLENNESENPIHYTKRPLWWSGLFLMALGEIGNFAAYGFAPASLVAPLGTSTVIANMFIAVTFLKEKLRPEDVFGCSLAVIGAFLLVTYSKKDEPILTARNVIRLLGETSFIVYAILEGVIIGLLLFLKYYVQVQSVVITLLIGSLIASFTVIATKAVSGMLQLTIGGYMQLDQFIFWFMLVVVLATCVVTVNFLNQAMASYDSTVVVPTNFVLFTTSTIVAGIIFFKEFYGLSAVNIFMFLFGCLLCFLGVFFITSARSHKERQVAAESSDEFYRLHLELFPTWIFDSIFTIDLDLVPLDLTIAIDDDQTELRSFEAADIELSNLPRTPNENLFKARSVPSLYRTGSYQARNLALSCDITPSYGTLTMEH